MLQALYKDDSRPRPPLPLLCQLAPCSVTPCTMFRKPPPLLSSLLLLESTTAAAAATDVSVRARSANVALPPPFIRSCRASPTDATDSDIHGHGFRLWGGEEMVDEGESEVGGERAGRPPQRRPSPAAQRPGPSSSSDRAAKNDRLCLPPLSRLPLPL